MTGVILKAPGPKGWGTTLTDADSGNEIKGISRIGLEILPDDLIRIEATMLTAEIEVNGSLVVYVADPSTGKMKEPAKIEFKDGSIWEA